MRFLVHQLAAGHLGQVPE